MDLITDYRALNLLTKLKSPWNKFSAEHRIVCSCSHEKGLFGSKKRNIQKANGHNVRFDWCKSTKTQSVVEWNKKR